MCHESYEVKNPLVHILCSSANKVCQQFQRQWNLIKYNHHKCSIRTFSVSGQTHPAGKTWICQKNFNNETPLTKATSCSNLLTLEVLENGPNGWQPAAQSQFTSGLSCTWDAFSYGALTPPTAEASPAKICRCASEGKACLLSVSDT